MRKVYDVRLNDYAGQIVWMAPMINEHGDIYGWSYYKEQQNKFNERQVIIGFDSHNNNCYCDRCRRISNVYDQIYIDPNLSPTHNFTW